jgi:hypothetical protein
MSTRYPNFGWTNCLNVNSYQIMIIELYPASMISAVSEIKCGWNALGTTRIARASTILRRVLFIFMNLVNLTISFQFNSLLEYTFKFAKEGRGRNNINLR